MIARWVVFFFIGLLAQVKSTASTQLPSRPVENAIARCKALVSSDFSQLEDAPTQILDAISVTQGGQLPRHCEIKGYVSPSFGFVLQLPLEKWNGKFIEHGCGGFCGDVRFFLWRCDDPLRRGYACILSDGGHKSSVTDLKWAYNNPQALNDYFIRAGHLTALAGKAIVEKYYGKAPDKSYFMGCSMGGLQALSEAHGFPWDFDGVFAISPAHDLTGSIVNLLWGNRALMGVNGDPLLGREDLEALHEAVIEKCDLNDGVKDGLIGDPRACHFKPEELRCTAARRGRCLTSEKIDAAEKIYSGPVTSTGERITLPAALVGSELAWAPTFAGSFRNPAVARSFFISYYNIAGEWLRYSHFQPNAGPSWKPEDFDFDRDYKRLGLAEILEPVSHPDLRRFKAKGGKLIIAAGFADAITGAAATIDYYETVERLMGGRAATQGFFRLFVFPGMEHGGGGDGAFAVDYLSYLEAWVERGEAPDELVGFHVGPGDLRPDDPSHLDQLRKRLEFPFPAFLLEPSIATFSRPAYPYPARTQYRGRGDPKVAASFGPVAR